MSSANQSPRRKEPTHKLTYDEPQGPQISLPPLTHTLHQENSSVLSLAADENWIFSGSQGMDIYVWDRDTFTLSKLLQGHTGSVLCLEVSAERKWLFSSSGDSSIRVWATETLMPLYTLTPFADYNSGDIFCLTFSTSTNTLFFGCQNTSLQWFDFSPGSKEFAAGASSDNPYDLAGASITGLQAPRKPHKFFDSEPKPPGHLATPGPSTPQRGIPSPRATPGSSSNTLPETGSPHSSGTQHLTETGVKPKEPRELAVPSDNWVPSAHHGYVYCIALAHGHEAQSQASTKGTQSVQLVTGSGDEDVRLWSYTNPSNKPAGMKCIHTFHSGMGAVLSIVSQDGTIYAGCQDGHVKVWDIETKTLVRTLIVHEGVDILCVSIVGTELYVGSANGGLQRYSGSFDRTGCWKGHSGAALSSIITSSRKMNKTDRDDQMDLITGASDSNIKVWAIKRPPKRAAGQLKMASGGESAQYPSGGFDDNEIQQNDTVVHALSQFVSFPSVSSHHSHKEDCRQAAIWLKKCLTLFGAESQLLYGVEGKNPVVFGSFRGTEGRAQKPRILFYGHYDVIAPGPRSAWDNDPWTLTGLNGYLYGRGASDNKGPTLVVASAASELLARRALDVDLVMLIEGEEEVGSSGFVEAVQKHKDQIGHIDGILVSNSYWIDDARPCITYGLRGVVHATIDITGEGPDVHSGVDGGASVEPMADMIKLLAKLSDGSRIAVPGFYDHVRAASEEEDGVFRLLAEITGRTPQSFSARWREPSLSIHSISDSGLGNSTVIPGRVRAKLSVRIVPDQDPPTIVASLEVHLHSAFAGLHSPNSLKIHIDRAADWWIGNLEHPWFKVLENSIRDEWGVKPLRIREGGSIPSVPWLEKEFQCPALHLPMGQSTDQAHLRNERISLNNLRKGKAVVSRFLERVASQM